MSWTPPDAPAENAIANRGEATAESGEEGEEEEEQETRPAATTAANEKGTIMRGIVPSSESVFGAKYTAFPQMVPSVAEPGISRVSGEPDTSSLGSPQPGRSTYRNLTSARLTSAPLLSAKARCSCSSHPATNAVAGAAM